MFADPNDGRMAPTGHSHLGSDQKCQERGEILSQRVQRDQRVTRYDTTFQTPKSKNRHVTNLKWVIWLTSSVGVTWLPADTARDWRNEPMKGENICDHEHRRWSTPCIHVLLLCCLSSITTEHPVCVVEVKMFFPAVWTCAITSTVSLWWFATLLFTEHSQWKRSLCGVDSSLHSHSPNVYDSCSTCGKSESRFRGARRERWQLVICQVKGTKTKRVHPHLSSPKKTLHTRTKTNNIWFEPICLKILGDMASLSEIDWLHWLTTASPLSTQPGLEHTAPSHDSSLPSPMKRSLSQPPLILFPWGESVDAYSCVGFYWGRAGGCILLLLPTCTNLQFAEKEEQRRQPKRSCVLPHPEDSRQPTVLPCANTEGHGPVVPTHTLTHCGFSLPASWGLCGFP